MAFPGPGLWYNVPVGATIQQLASRYGLTAVYLFGSRAEEGRRFLEGVPPGRSEASDLDIAVVFATLPTDAVHLYGELFRDLGALFGPFEVDLVFFHETSPLFRYEIIRGVRVFAADAAAADDAEESVMREAADLSFNQRVFVQDVLEAITDGYREVEYNANK